MDKRLTDDDNSLLRRLLQLTREQYTEYARRATELRRAEGAAALTTERLNQIVDTIKQGA